jgi:hypothetical protein
MRTSYGVVWREGDHPLARGKLELLPRAVRLDGMAGSVPTTREIAYDYLTEIRIGRSPEERIDGRPSLVLEPRTGDTLSIASVAQAGVLAEIAEDVFSWTRPEMHIDRSLIPPGLRNGDSLDA